MSLMNGHAHDAHDAPAAPVMMPFAVPAVRFAGPASDWPQDDGVTPDKRGRRWHVMPAMRVVFAHRGWLAAIPVILVNAVAFAGQLAFLRTHLPWPLAGQVLVAVTLESVAVYLAWQAHLALAADDSALRLRVAAYGFAAVIGVLNYSHYMSPHWRPTFAAVTFGLMSLSSPWLWSVHSRRASRDALKARGLIEPHAVRLGATRWMWHPVRSWRVMFRATWQGVSDPVVAVALTPLADTAGDSSHRAAGDITEPPLSSEVTAAQITSHPASEIPQPLEVTPARPAAVTPDPVSSQVPGKPEVTRQVKAQGKVAARPPRISDADLKEEIRVLFDTDPKVSINAAADRLGRSRDRVRPLLEQVRAEKAGS